MLISVPYIIFPQFMALISPVLVPTLCFYFREEAQAEERWIDKYAPDRLRKYMPWDAGFRLVVWDTHSLFGFLGPALACLLLVGLSYCFKRFI
jgi:hypothetical protein